MIQIFHPPPIYPGGEIEDSDDGACGRKLDKVMRALAREDPDGYYGCDDPADDDDKSLILSSDDEQVTFVDEKAKAKEKAGKEKKNNAGKKKKAPKAAYSYSSLSYKDFNFFKLVSLNSIPGVQGSHVKS